MRQYRGKRIDNGEWVYGWYTERFTPDTDWQTLMPHIALVDKQNELQVHQVHPDTVGQSTGKDDVFSKVMFGGDTVKIVKSKWPAYQHTQAYAEVCWDKYRAGFYLKEYIKPEHPNGRIISDIHNYRSTDIEIIGTIHDKETS